MPWGDYVNDTDNDNDNDSDYHLWSLYHEVGLPHPHEELVILEPPAPVLVAHSVHLGAG